MRSLGVDAGAAGRERIPPSVHAPEVSVSRPNRPPTSDVSVTTAAEHGSCEPMTLTVKGHPRTPLLGGTSVVGAAQRLLGIRLPRA